MQQHVAKGLVCSLAFQSSQRDIAHIFSSRQFKFFLEFFFRLWIPDISIALPSVSGQFLVTRKKVCRLTGKVISNCSSLNYFHRMRNPASFSFHHYTLDHSFCGISVNLISST